MLNMYPMDFEEFLIANGNIALINEIEKYYENNIAMDSVLHEKALNLYRLYLCVGGMYFIFLYISKFPHQEYSKLLCFVYFHIFEK